MLLLILAWQLVLGRWQEIAFLDFDNRRRDRRIIVQMVGEAQFVIGHLSLVTCEKQETNDPWLTIALFSLHLNMTIPKTWAKQLHFATGAG
jgi:hypothetical protein